MRGGRCTRRWRGSTKRKEEEGGEGPRHPASVHEWGWRVGVAAAAERRAADGDRAAGKTTASQFNGGRGAPRAAVGRASVPHHGGVSTRRGGGRRGSGGGARPVRGGTYLLNVNATTSTEGMTESDIFPVNYFPIRQVRAMPSTRWGAYSLCLCCSDTVPARLTVVFFLFAFMVRHCRTSTFVAGYCSCWLWC